MAVLTSCAAFGAAAHTQGQGNSGPPVSAAYGKDAARDAEYGGIGTLTGLTEVQTGPSTIVPYGNCPVWIFDQKSGYLVRSTVSAASGAYSVPLIRPDKTYFAVAWDPAGTYDVAATRSLQVTS